MKRGHIALVWVCIAMFAVAAIGSAMLAFRRIDQGRDVETKLRRLCSGAKDAMRQDATAFEGSGSTAREEAYQRFYEGHALYHSAESLQYCLDTLPGMPVGCELNKDWACLAKLARQLEHSL